MATRRSPSLVSIVIPVRNEAARIGEQLRALAVQDYPGRYEIVIVDHASTDDLAGAVAAVACDLLGGVEVRVVPAGGGRGAAHPRNVGFAAARGELICCCDADDAVTSSWLSALVRASADADAVGGVQIPHPSAPPEALVWRAGAWHGPRPTDLSFLPYASSCNMAVWKAVADDIGGWNEEFWRGGEDIEFSWRLQLRGYRIGWAEDAVVRYRVRTDFGGLRRQMRSYGVSRPHLLREFRPYGARRASSLEFGRTLWWLASRAPRTLRSRTVRGLWVAKAARLAGRLEGCVRQRAWCP